MAEKDDILREAHEAFRQADDAEGHNRTAYLDDIRFAREGVQWPEDIVKQRQIEGRPVLTINKLPAFIRQVVNDARQNKPAIKVHPADSGADKETAEIINGLIRNIEYTSNADVAYDTAVECAVTGGFGYLRVGLDYAFDDSFDMDLSIERVANPLSVYGDPNATAADSSDWSTSFVVDRMTKPAFKAKYGDKATVDWDDTMAWSAVSEQWRDKDTVMVAEWWRRDEAEQKVVMLDNGTVLARDALETDEDLMLLLEQGIVSVSRERVAKTHKVTQRIISGVEVLETNAWPGRYIPIIPVYGDEFDIEGKRFFRSLVHNAVDAQRMFNYWRTTSTELVALAPRVPYIGRKGAFDHDQDRWNTANTQSHAYLEYDGPEAPQRQPLDMGVAAGALQEALNASDDMKSIIGIYDASLGARSNETSGKAILARQREGDISTFHFMDNMSRAIRHTGRVLIDLIPKVYSGPRIIRVLGEDGKAEVRPVNQEVPQVDPQTGQEMKDGRGEAIMRMHDLTAGKYDLTVTTGPSFTTRREEAAMQMTEMIRAFPAAAPVVGPELAKNLDWPGADDIADKLEQMTNGQVPPQVQQAIEQGKQQIEQLSQENQKLKQDQSDAMAKIEADKQIAAAKIAAEKEIAMAKIQAEQEIEAYKAQLNAAAVASRPVITAPNSRPSA